MRSTRPSTVLRSASDGSSKVRTLLSIGLGLILACELVTTSAIAQEPVGNYTTDQVTFPSGTLKLRGLLGKPAGTGPFPVFIYNHSSATAAQAAAPLATRFGNSNLLDRLVRSGYVVLSVARRGYFGSEGTSTT
ncbi:MAG: alpha/beta hydrolase family protein, partial [bacterium]